MQHDFILLDRSSSMLPRWEEALGSVNAYVRQLAKDDVDTGVTLVAFDQDLKGRFSFEVLRDRITPKTWRRVSSEDASPRGGTPLNDATARIVALANAGKYDKVAIIIMTDGEENSSREYRDVAKVRELLDQCRAKNWQIIFLGADFDNQRQGASYGNTANATVDMSVGNFALGTTMTASKRAVYGATGQSMSFNASEKAELAKKTSS